jgi:hypothetical protein
MATPKTDATPTAAVTVTGQHNGQDVQMLGGMDLRDKAELVGRPFYITGLKLTVNERDIAYVWVEGEFEDNQEPFSFNDASTGVRAQLMNYLASEKRADVLNEWTDCRIFIPRGLRVSRYDATDERGRTVQAKTFYLTTAGTR